MKIIVTKGELLELCSRCAERSLQGLCSDYCIFGDECDKAYINFWNDNTEIKKSDDE